LQVAILTHNHKHGYRESFIACLLNTVSSSIFIELLVSGIASVVYKINGRQYDVQIQILSLYKQTFIQTSLKLVLFS